MNIVQKFKQKRNLSKFLIGGQIPKLQTTWQPLYTEQQRAAAEWERQNAARTTELISNAVKQADKRIERRERANQRANRKTKAPMINNTAKLQEALYKAGFFDEGTTFNKAVDGIRGKMTNRAIQRAKDAGYNVNIDAGTISPNSNKERNLGESFNMVSPITNVINSFSFLRNSFKDSQNTGLQAIFDHENSRLFTRKRNYGVVDKKNATFSIYNGDNLLYQIPIVLGKNRGDGLPSGRWNSEASGTTGAGVFKIHVGEANPSYVTMEKQLQLMSDDDDPNKYVRHAFHSPAGQSRISALKLPASQRRRSNGCFSGQCGDIDEILAKNLLSSDDIVYVLPEIDGNELVEQNGKMQIKWGTNNPETYKDSKGTIRKFRYNQLKI